MNGVLDIAKLLLKNCKTFRTNDPFQVGDIYFNKQISTEVVVRTALWVGKKIIVFSYCLLIIFFIDRRYSLLD